MSDETWSINKIQSTMGHRFGPPQPPPNHTIVVFHRGVCLGPLGPHLRLNLNDCRQGFYEFWVVPTGNRKLPVIATQLASNVPGVYFSLTLEIQYHVSSPEKVARQHAATLPEDVGRELRRMLQQHANRYGPLEWQKVEQAIENDLLRRRQLDAGVETTNPLVKVTLDLQVEKRYREAFDIRDGAVIADAELERDLQQVQRDMRRDQVQTDRALADDTNKDQLRQRRMDRYIKVLSQGRVEQFAAMLADPDNTNLKDCLLYTSPSPRD